MFSAIKFKGGRDLYDPSSYPLTLLLVAPASFFSASEGGWQRFEFLVVHQASRLWLSWHLTGMFGFFGGAELDYTWQYFGAFFWPSAQESLLAGLRGPYRVPGIEPGSIMCKTMPYLLYDFSNSFCFFFLTMIKVL